MFFKRPPSWEDISRKAREIFKKAEKKICPAKNKGEMYGDEGLLQESNGN
jgi:hypothetical protein